MVQRILLVRHGRSAHLHPAWMDRAGFLGWREAYEKAGLEPLDRPPHELTAFASTCGLVVSSDALRALESARLVAAGREVTTSSLLSELELAPPAIPGVRMPLMGWAIAIGVRWAVRAALRRSTVYAAELQRSRDAAAWLTDLATRHESVMAMTHASFRGLLSRRLTEEGWRCEVPKKRTAHWSAWSFSRE